MKNDNLTRCSACGVILIDPRRKKIRSCPHKPLTVELVDGKSVIMLGVIKWDDTLRIVDKSFDKCFSLFISS